MYIFRQHEKFTRVLLIIATVTSVAVPLIYLSNFHGKLSDTQADWGTFGDFIGGALNPILSFLNFIALILTINLQSKEIKKSKEREIESAKIAEKTSDNQAKTAKSQEIISKIAAIQLLLSYDNKTLNEFSGNTSSHSQVTAKQLTGKSTRELLTELGKLYQEIN